MATVTQRIDEIRQPKNGYLPISSFERIYYKCDDRFLFPHEDIHPTSLGSVVDYLTRFMFSQNPTSAFHISIQGAIRAGEEERARSLLTQIKGLDDKSICAACNLVSYDVFLRNYLDAFLFTRGELNRLNEIDQTTITNIRCMVERAMYAIGQNGQYVMDGITFEGGYSDLVSSGDADFATTDTLWDMKVSTQRRPSSKDTLQLLLYYVMGCHSKHKEFFNNLNYIAIINPRQSSVYRYPTKEINPTLLQIIEETVICYGKTKEEIQNEAHSKQYNRIKNGEWLNTIETCELLFLSKKTVYTMGHIGYLHPQKRGTTYYYDPNELLQWCDEAKTRLTFAEWKDLGIKKFGTNKDNWKFKCPMCGRIATVEQIKTLTRGKLPLYDACHRCISYYDINKSNSCGYRYWSISEGTRELAFRGVVILDDKNHVHHAFDFADNNK